MRTSDVRVWVTQVIQDSAFLDLYSPITPYEGCKMVLMFPWVLVKLIVSILGLALVWTWIRVRAVPFEGCSVRYPAR